VISWWRRRKSRQAYKWAREHDAQILTNAWLLNMYRVLRKANEELGNVPRRP
jgi:hypothetical protein